ncbi:MAG: alpha/beta fold hydrolase [Microcoleaceae cyanobacterium]
MTINENTLKVGDLEWFYREVNPAETDKIPILLLHGLVSQSYSWTLVLEGLAAQGYRAIAPDWIGSGFSQIPEKREFDYTPDSFINALAELIQALELQSFHLIVQGFLGSVGLQYALRYPQQIERLIILNTPITAPVKLPWKIQQMGLPFVGDMMTQDPLLVDRTLEGGSGFVIEDQDLDVYRRPFLKSSAAGRALMAVIKNLQLKSVVPEIEAGLKTWKNPVQIIWGMGDPWLRAEPIQVLVQSMPQAEFVKLEDAKHYPQNHWPKEINESIIFFLRKQAIS